VHIGKTDVWNMEPALFHAANHGTIAVTNTQTYTRVTRQGRMALTGVDARNTIKC